MHFKFKKNSEELYDIQCKLVSYSFDNTKWSCLYSGLGIIKPMTKKEVALLSSIKEYNEDVDFVLQNYVPVACIYEKGIPIFALPSKEILNPGKYMWDDKHHKKNLSIEAQAYAILSLCYSIELIGDDSPMEKYMLLKTSKMIYDFVSTYLRNDEGLYVDGTDKSKLTEPNKKIKLEDKKFKINNQIIMFEALLYLHRISSNETHSKLDEKCSYRGDNENYKLEASNILEYIEKNIDLFLEQSTKELSNTISSIARSLSFSFIETLKPNMLMLLSQLCAELHARVKITGEVEKSSTDSISASLTTQVKVNSALSEGYLLTGIEHFRKSAIKINQSLLDFYDPSNSIFYECMLSDISYSIADITDLIIALMLNYRLTADKETLFIIKEIYYNIFEKHQLVQSIAASSIKINEEQIELNDMLPQMNDLNKAPVFMKNIKFERNNPDILPKVSKFFSSKYGLYSSYMFLYYMNEV
jgi:hypothetical protein